MLPAWERELLVPAVETKLDLRLLPPLEWSSFLLNPRRLRGSDFLMRWQQGVWTEKRFIEALSGIRDFFAIPYGPSSVAPTDDMRKHELYFERLEAAGLGSVKRPDLLIFHRKHESQVFDLLKTAGGVEELPFIPEGDLRNLVQLATLAVECENSLWVAEEMPAYGEELRPMKRLGGKPGLPKNAVLPTVIIKEEDRSRLLCWEQENGKPIHIWHAFYDRAYGLALSRAEELIKEKLIAPREQTYQAPGGTVTKKITWGFYYHYAYDLARSVQPPRLVAEFIKDPNGHILPYVRFREGSLHLSGEAFGVLRSLSGHA